MPQTIGEVQAKLSVDLKEFNTKLDEATRRIETVARDIDRALGGVEQSSRKLGASQDELGSKVASATGWITKAALADVLWHHAIKPLSRELRTIKGHTGALAGTLAQLTARVKAAHVTVSGFSRVALAGLRAGLVGIATVLSVKLAFAFGKWLDQLGASGAQMAVTRQGFDNLAESIDETGESMMKRLRAATLGTVDDFSLLKTGSFALQTRIAATGKQMEEMAHLATILALSVGKDAAEGFDILTTGTARHSVILLKQLGLVVEADRAYEHYAGSIGKTVGQLDEQERALAFTAEVMRKARENVARLNLDTDNLAVINARAAASAISLRQAFASEVAAAEQLVGFKKDLLGFTIDLRSQTQALAPALGLLANEFFRVARAQLAIVEGKQPQEAWAASFIDNIQQSDSAAGDFLRTLEAIGAELDAIIRKKGIQLGLVTPRRAVAPGEEVAAEMRRRFIPREAPTAERDYFPLPPEVPEEWRNIQVVGENIASTAALAAQAGDIMARSFTEAGGIIAANVAQSSAFMVQAGAIEQSTQAMRFWLEEYRQGGITIGELNAQLHSLGLTSEEIDAKFEELGVTTKRATKEAAAQFESLEVELGRIGVNVGRNLVFGIIDGINSAKDILKQVLKALASLALSWFAGELGILSPSREFKKMGEQIDAGLALGIRSGYGSIAAATGGMTHAAIAGASMSAPTINIDGASRPGVASPREVALDSWWLDAISETNKNLQDMGAGP